MRHTFLQLMECQVGALRGAAPVDVAVADISAYLPESVGRRSRVTEDLREVSTLSSGVMLPLDKRLNPYPTDYRSALAWSLFLYLPSHEPLLRETVPNPTEGGGEDDRLTTFRRRSINREWGREGRSFPPVVQHLRQGNLKPRNLTTYHFGPSLTASLACS